MIQMYLDIEHYTFFSFVSAFLLLGGISILTFLGVSMVVVFTYLIMAKRLSPVAALVIVPIVFALISGLAQSSGI